MEWKHLTLIGRNHLLLKRIFYRINCKIKITLKKIYKNIILSFYPAKGQLTKVTGVLLSVHWLYI